MALTTATIPAEWSPGSTCQNSSEHWIWFDSRWGMGVLGPPDQSSSCYPPDYTPTLGQLYTADTCPDGFTPACTTNYYSSSWSTLCCPTGKLSYSCNYKSFWSWTAACITSVSPYTTIVTMTLTSFGNSVQSTDATLTVSRYSVLNGSLTTSGVLTTTGIFSYVTTYEPNHWTWAFGVPISPSASSVDASSNVPSTTGFNTSPSTSYGSGLSAGASAGIAIGALISAIFIALGIWFLYRRVVNKRRVGGKTDSSGRQSSSEEQQPKPPVTSRPEGYIPKRSPVEMHDVDLRQYELDGTRRYAELP